MKSLIISATLLFASSLIFAQGDTIHAKNNKLLLSNLKEGKTSYLVYFTDSAFNRKGTGDIWERTVTFIKRNDQPVIEFGWNWLHNDSLYATITNICDAKTLAPIYHKATYKQRGVFAFDYRDDKMIASDSIADNNASKRPAVDLIIPIISWEQDLETYPLLPIKKVGQQFDIAFFDPNEKTPAYHRYEIVGKEMLQLNTDTKINCWLLKIDYGRGASAIFWLSEKSKEVIKMQEKFGNNYRFKVRLY